MNARIAILSLHLLSMAAVASAGNIDVIFYDNRFGTVNTTTGAYTQVSTLPISAAAGIASDAGILYVEDLGSNLLTVDPLTGAAQMVGNSALNLSALIFAGSNNGLFEVDSASNLYSISTTTGQATLVGATGLPTNLSAYDTSLSSDGSSLLVTAGTPGSGDELYRINTSTGRATDLGNTGVTGVAGSAFINGNLDLFQYGQSTNYIYSAPDGSIAFAAGSSLNAQIIDGGVATLSGTDLASPSSSPEPATMLLAGSALTVVLAFSVCLKRRSEP